MNHLHHTPVTLLVEEEPLLLEEDMRSLLCQNHFSVLTSGSREEALELAKKNRIDLFVVSGVRPTQSALDFVSHFRNERQTRNIPLILLSSFYRSPRMEEIVERSPKTKYLIAPIPSEDLLDTLWEVLKEHKAD